MIWLTWRQFRAGAAMMFAALAALAAIAGLTGPGLADDFSTGIAGCVTQSRGCSDFLQRFYHDNQEPFLAGTAVMLVLPALIGLFWGAPLVTRELETGTHRLVWNQSVTRTRWLAIKLALVGLAAMAAGGLGSLAVTWWSGPLDKSAASSGFPRMGPLLFAARGIVPIGYAAFAFALGVTVGTLVRRTLPAMTITLAVFVAVQIAMPLLVRPHLLAPARSTIAISSSNVDDLNRPREGGALRLTVKAQVADDTGAWVLSSHVVDASGRTSRGDIPVSTSTGPCGAPPSPRNPGERISACFAEITRLGYRQRLTYQPSGRFWTFQWYETGIYTALSLALAGLGFSRIRRGLS
jgi:hypothetical protein